MGFGNTSTKRASTMLLVALVSDKGASGVRDAVAAGADVALLAGAPGEKELADAVAAADGRPCGLVVEDTGGGALSDFREAGVDFLVSGPDSPAESLLDEELTVVFHLREDLTDVQLRTLDGMAVDAVYVDLEAVSSPTIRDQMALSRISGLTRKPLLLVVPPDAGREHLLSLRDAGVALLGLDLASRGAGDALRQLRSTIDALPLRERPRHGEGAEVTIPHAAGEMPPAEESEEE